MKRKTVKKESWLYYLLGVTVLVVVLFGDFNLSFLEVFKKGFKLFVFKRLILLYFALMCRCSDYTIVVPTAASIYLVPLGRAVYLGEPTTAVVRPILSFPRTRE